MSLDEQTMTISLSLCERLRREVRGIELLLTRSMADEEWITIQAGVEHNLRRIAAEFYNAQEHALADRCRQLGYDLRLWRPSLAEAACEVLTRLVALEHRLSTESLHASCDEMRALWAGWQDANTSEVAG